MAPAPPQLAPVVGGQGFTISLSISPAQLIAGSGDAGTLTVQVTQSSNGQPPADGTLVQVNTDLGNFGTSGQGEIKLETVGLSGGTARVSLFPGDEIGTANVLATIGETVSELLVPITEGGPVFVTSVTPQNGSPAGGTQVVVQGGGFVAPLRVNFGSAAATVTSSTASRITAVTPPSDQPVGPNGTVSVDVTVTAMLDQPTPVSGTLPGGFVYANAGQAVFVTQVEPGSGGATGGERVRVLGGGFEAPVQVTFGGTAGSSPSVVSGAEIAVTVPPPTTPVGAGETLAVDVVVTSGLNQSQPQTATLPGGYIYRGEGAETVFVTQVLPNAGDADGGETVRVLGGGFVTPLRVDFGSNAGLSPVLVSATEIQVQVPPPTTPVGAGETLTVDVTVTAGLDQPTPPSGTLPGGYVYQGEAVETITVTAITPTEGPIAGGTEVTVTGSGFVSPIAVELAGARQASEVFVNGTTVRFTTAGTAVSTCPASGRVPQVGVAVINLGSGARGSTDLTFDYIVSRPRIDRVAPTAGPQLGNTIVSLEGAGFSAPSRVVFVAGGAEFAGVVQSVTDAVVTVASPRLPDTAFPETACTTGGGTAGVRFTNVTASVRITQTDTGCEDTLPNAFTYQPTDTSCRTASP